LLLVALMKEKAGKLNLEWCTWTMGRCMEERFQTSAKQ